MKLNRVHRYRIYPSRTQREILETRYRSAQTVVRLSIRHSRTVYTYVSTVA